MYHMYGELVQERGMLCTDILKIRALWVQVGKHSQQMCPWPCVTGKFVTRPMSYVAALHLYRIKVGTKVPPPPL